MTTGSTDTDRAAPRVAIVGSGPAGLYTVRALVRAGVAVDVYERLPSPFGLVRGGVAPDHPTIRRVADVLRRVLASPRVRFIGNVTVGRDVTIPALTRCYHAVVVATGAPLPRPLGVPGESLPGVVPATDLVGWYNAHPDQHDVHLDLRAVRRVVVVGNGNVAIDVARVLTRPVADLAVTDIAHTALEALRHSAVEEVVLLGRRGPAQAAFSSRELRKLAELDGVDVVVDPMPHDPQTAAWLATAPRDARDTVALLEALALRPRAAHRAIRLTFLASPEAFLGTDRLTAVRLAHNALVWRDGEARPEPTGHTTTVPAELAVTAIGHLLAPPVGVPFARGRVPHREGRVLDADGAPVPGLYVAGWVKRGPTGLVGDNVSDAAETAAAVLADLDAAPRVPDDPTALLDGLRVVDLAGWDRLDAEEIRRGAAVGKPRERFDTVEAMLAHIDRPTGSSSG